MIPSLSGVYFARTARKYQMFLTGGARLARWPNLAIRCNWLPGNHLQARLWARDDVFRRLWGASWQERGEKAGALGGGLLTNGGCHVK